MGRALGHPAAATTRTEAAPLAGKRHQVLTRAAFAAKAGKATLKHATHQELPELALDELREAHPVARLRGLKRRKASRCSPMTRWSAVCSASRGRYTGSVHATPLGTARARMRQCPQMDTLDPALRT